MKFLIIGYGRAGKRHQRELEVLGHTVETCDPYNSEATYGSLSKALRQSEYDGAVLASPPDAHLAQIETCVAHRLPVLCEKPLCALGEIEAARHLTHKYSDWVMLAYNYRYHAVFQDPLQHWVQHADSGVWLLDAQQQRAEWPAWGFLLDHFSHSIDTLSWLAGGLTVRYAHEAYLDSAYSAEISGVTKVGTPFTIREYVTRSARERRVWLDIPLARMELFVDKGMYSAMTENYLGMVMHKTPAWPTMFHALAVQEVLESAAALLHG